MKHTFGRAFKVSVVDILELYVRGGIVLMMVFMLVGFRIWEEVWVCI